MPWKRFGSRGDPRLRLASVLAARGAFAEAVPLRRRDLEATERQLGPEHRETLVSVHNLASVLQQLGQYGEAPWLRCAVGSRGRFCILFWDKLRKKSGKHRETINTFSDHLNIVSCI